MRRAAVAAVFALAALVVGAAPAAAHDENPFFHVEITPYREPIMPETDAIGTEVEARVSCGLFGDGDATAQVRFGIVESPEWVSATVEPDVVTVRSRDCVREEVSARATLSIATHHSGPALTGAPVAIEAVFRSPSSEQTVTGRTNVQADFLGLLDAETPVRERTTTPGELVVIPVNVTNLGNGDARLNFGVRGVPSGWQVVPPAATIVQSAHAGEELNTKTVFVQVFPPDGLGRIESSMTMTLEITSQHAIDTTRLGESAELAIEIAVEGFGTPGMGGAPVLVALAMIALLGGVLMRRDRED